MAWSTGIGENTPRLAAMRSLRMLFSDRPPTYSMTM